MNLRETIRACDRCSLHKNMETCPVPPEWTGHPILAVVVDSVITENNDFMQEVITGVNRKRFIQLLGEAGITDYYLTNLVKCKPNNGRYTAANIKACKEWISYEFERLKPKLIVGCGKNTAKIFAHHYFPSVNTIVSSRKSEEEFIDKLKVLYDKQK